MVKAQSCMRISFLDYEKVEKFVEALSYLTAFFYLTEANGQGNYLCDVSGIDLFASANGPFQKVSCLEINFPLMNNWYNCADNSSQNATVCAWISQTGQECGMIVGSYNSLAPLTIAGLLLGVSVAVLLVLLYFSAGEPDEMQALEKRHWTKRGCKTYFMDRVKAWRMFACAVQFVVILFARLWYKQHHKLCVNPTITTSTGLLVFWPMAFVATLATGYPLGVVLGSPVIFRCIEGKSYKDATTEEDEAQDNMAAMREIYEAEANQPKHVTGWKRATATAGPPAESNGDA